MSDAWLHEREALQFMSGRFYVYDRAGNCIPNPELDLRPWEDPLHAGCEDYRDAAEFEARVAEKLAWHATIYYRRGCRYGDEDDTPSDFEILRDARIQVEEEMDG